MRILHVIHGYAPAVGGSELLFQQLAEGMKGRGHEVGVYTSTALRASDFVQPDATGLPPGREDIHGVEVRRFAYRRFPRLMRKGFNIAGPFWWKRRWPGYDKAKVAWIGPYLPGLIRSAVRWRPDIIVAATAPFRTLYLAEIA